MNTTFKIKKLRENAVVPKRATEGSAGADLYACIDQPLTIAPGSLVMVPTGIALELPETGLAAFLFARSGLGVKHGICLSNGVGVVDSDYRGEIRVPMINWSDEDFVINDGDRIAQVIITSYEKVNIELVEDLSETERGEGGFGHTGV